MANTAATRSEQQEKSRMFEEWRRMFESEKRQVDEHCEQREKENER